MIFKTISVGSKSSLVIAQVVSLEDKSEYTYCWVIRRIFVSVSIFLEVLRRRLDGGGVAGNGGRSVDGDGVDGDGVDGGGVDGGAGIVDCSINGALSSFMARVNNDVLLESDGVRVILRAVLIDIYRSMMLYKRSPFVLTLLIKEFNICCS